MTKELYRARNYDRSAVAKRYVGYRHWWIDGKTRLTVFEVNSRGRTIREYDGDATVPSETSEKAWRLYAERLAFNMVEWPL